MRRLVVWIGIVGVALLLPAAAGAQGIISGLVEDTTGGILPGVTVEADSPVNIEGTLTAFTDGAGRFTITQLRPGTYTVTFTLPGFSTVVNEEIIISGNATVQVNAQLQVGALEETVTVSGESPVVDVQQVRRQFVATRAMMDVLPAARTFAARALLIPGVRNTGMGEGQYWPAVHGSTWRDAQTLNDGMRANSTVDDGQWQMGWEMNDAATSELTFEAGGAPAEAQVGGVVQNAIPKEGGNTFSGTWFTYYGGGGMAWDNANAELREQLGEVNELVKDYDTNPAFGGKFIQDKLWFFTSFRARETKRTVAGAFFAAPGEPCRPAGPKCTGQQEALDYFGVQANDQAFYRTTSLTGLLRLTNQVTDRHKWRVGFERVNRQHPLVDVSNISAPERSDRIRQPTGYHAQARWTSSLSNRLLVEAGFSVQYNKWRREPFPWNTAENNMQTSTLDLSTGTWGGSWWITGWQPEKSRYVKGSVSYVTGSHNFKAGAEHRWGNISLDQPMFADTRNLFYWGDTPVGVMVLATPLGPGLNKPGQYGGQINFDTGLFAQDSWTLGNLTLNLGTRADIFSAGVPPQSAPAGTWLPAREFPAYDGPRFNTVVARVGLAYDLFGDGRTALKGTMHQYVSQEATRIAMLRNPLSSWTWSAAQEFRSWNDLDGNDHIVGPDGRVQFEEVGASPNVNFGTANDLRGLNLSGREGHWEYAAVIQHEMFPGISMSFGWYRRNYHNMWWEDNILRGDNDWTPFDITGPEDERLGDYSGSSYELYNLNEDNFGLSNVVISTSDVNDRIYDGFEYTMDGRLSNGAFFGGSFTQERTQTNNCDTPSGNTSGYGIDDKNTLLWCDFPRAWQFMYKAHGAYPLPGGVILSGFVQGYPGPDISANYNVIELPNGDALTGGQRLSIDLLPPEVMFLDYQRKVDIRAMRRFNIGNTQIAPVVDVFNLFNTNTTTGVNSTYGDRWQEIISIMQARYVRIGLELEW